MHAQSCPTLCDPMYTRLPCPWVFSGKNTGVCCHFLLQWISPTQESNPRVLFFSALVGGFFTSWVTRQESQGACQRNDFSESKLLHLPIYRKVLNSLIWYILLSLTNSNLLMYQLLVFLAKLLFTLVPPLSLWSSPSELSESLPPRLEGLRKSAKWRIILNF